jgi:tubulin--tyrosine ligase
MASVAFSAYSFPSWFSNPSLRSCRADYDGVSFHIPHSNQTEYLTSCYLYCKALIRKHQLHLTITKYLPNCEHRGVRSVLAEGGEPKGWVIEVQFADDLEEALMDDLGELPKVQTQPSADST